MLWWFPRQGSKPAAPGRAVNARLGEKHESRPAERATPKPKCFRSPSDLPIPSTLQRQAGATSLTGLGSRQRYSGDRCLKCNQIPGMRRSELANGAEIKVAAIRQLRNSLRQRIVHRPANTTCCARRLDPYAEARARLAPRYRGARCRAKSWPGPPTFWW